MRPEAVIASLVTRAREEAATGNGKPDAEALRAGWERVLANLALTPNELDASRDGTDVLGAAYQRLLPNEQRRDLGQFYTPFWAGKVMAGWLLQAKPKVVLDPGVGSGALSIAVAEHRRRRTSTRVLGLDVDPLAVKMAETNAALRNIEGFEARIGNFLLDVLKEKPAGLICNPPYSRHHAIPSKEKEKIHADFEQRLGLKLSRLAGLHVLFLIRALELSAPDARLAFITPSDWLDVGYGQKVKDYLLKNARVEALIFIEPDHLFFDGVLTTAVITLIQKGQTGGETKVLRFGHKRPSPTAVLQAIEDKGRGAETLAVETVKLRADTRWARPQVKRRGGTALGEVARVRRGIATGANDFFVISEAKRRKLGIPERELTPCLTSPRIIVTDELTLATLDSLPDDVSRWLIDCRDAAVEQSDTPLGRYLRRGRRQGVHRGYLASRRKPWHSQETRGDCPIVFSYFNRERPVFIRNRAGAVPLNNWLIVEPRDGVDADELHAALASKAFIARLDDERRVYGGGLWKLEPKELEAVKLPNWK